MKDNKDVRLCYLILAGAVLFIALAIIVYCYPMYNSPVWNTSQVVAFSIYAVVTFCIWIKSLRNR